MNRIRARSLTLSLALATLVAAAGVAQSSGRYSIELEVAPDAERPAVYQARARITDLESGELVAAPRVLFPRGDEGQMRSGTSEGLDIGIRIAVDEAGETATCQTEIWQGDVLLSAQKMKLRLERSESMQ